MHNVLEEIVRSDRQEIIYPSRIIGIYLLYGRAALDQIIRI